MLLKKLNTCDDDLFYSSPNPTTCLCCFWGMECGGGFFFFNVVEFSLLVGVGGGELAGLRWGGLFSGLILPR